MNNSKYRPSLALLLILTFAQPAAAREPDLENGEDINELCAGCHGEYGQGGADGEYPRLAGQPASFLEKQMFLFRERKRTNMAMVEYVTERDAPDEDIQDVSAFLAQIKLPTRLPPLEEGAEFDPLERLLQAKKVLNIPRFEGDFENGERLYRRECRSCHGAEGEGREDIAAPMLTGQYTNYLFRQVAKYIEGERIHDEDDPENEILALFSEEELRDIFAYLSILDD